MRTLGFNSDEARHDRNSTAVTTAVILRARHTCKKLYIYKVILEKKITRHEITVIYLCANLSTSVFWCNENDLKWFLWLNDWILQVHRKCKEWIKKLKIIHLFIRHSFIYIRVIITIQIYLHIVGPSLSILLHRTDFGVSAALVIWLGLKVTTRTHKTTGFYVSVSLL